MYNQNIISRFIYNRNLQHLYLLLTLRANVIKYNSESHNEKNFKNTIVLMFIYVNFENTLKCLILKTKSYILLRDQNNVYCEVFMLI